MRFPLLVAVALLIPAIASADVLGRYFMSIHPQDMVNSRGVALSDMGQVLQQDRANYHRFGRRGPSDEGDPFFGNADLRAQIPALYAANPANRDLWGGRPPQVGRADFADILVFVCGSGGRITSIALDYADGDGYRGCP
ncbi:hypothetical protein HKCCE2091_11980 [Rhodobacterales bacterium HKCCE2091]|nr:hypothetical protein [Rhodobacterales bacterium HKCCE2091]